MKYASIKVDKPFYIGVAILDIAKLIVYDFHYNVMKRFYKENIQLLYTDTDSLVYEIKTEDLYKDFLNHFPSFCFDFSNYPSGHFLFSDNNNKKPGCFKDECGGTPITEFVGLRSKMYSMKLEPVGEKMREIKVAKGVKKPVINLDLKFQNYKECLKNSSQMEHDFHSIRSSAHKVVTSHQKKISLSAFDNKRYLLDNINSLPYGHYLIPADES